MGGFYGRGNGGGGFSGHRKKVTSFFNSLPSRNNVSKLFIISCSRGYYNSKLCSRFSHCCWGLLHELKNAWLFCLIFTKNLTAKIEMNRSFSFKNLKLLLSTWENLEMLFSNQGKTSLIICSAGESMEKKLTWQAGIIMVIINVFQYQWGNKVRFVHTFSGIKSTKIDSRHCIFILYEYFNLE